MQSAATTTDDRPKNAEATIEVRLRDLRQLFNSMDPSPFHEKDLDPEAERFIVGWAHDYPLDRPLRIVITLSESSSELDPSATVRDALQHFFDYEAAVRRRELRDLLKRGQISLAIGLVFLAACLFAGLQIERLAGEGSAVGLIAREGLLIGGWVAMWRPMEIFLYDWWPIRHAMRLFRKLARTPVEVVVPARS